MKRLTRRTRLVATAFLVSVLGSMSHDSAWAGVIFVTTTNDELNSNSECSLKEAIYAANFDTNMISTPTSFYSTGCLPGSGPDRIILPAQSVFLLSRITDEAQNPFGPTATPMITSNITIEADGSRFDWIGGNTHARAFAVASTGNLTLRFAHIRDFFAKGGDGAGGGGGGMGAGGAIYVKGGGQLTAEFSTFENNAAIGGNGSTDRAPNNSAGGGGGIGGDGGSGLGMGGGGGGGARGAGGAGSFFSGGQGEDVFVFGFGGGGGGTVGDGPFGGSGGNTGGFDCGGGASDQDDTAGEAGRCPGGGGGGGSSNLVGLAGVFAGGGDGGNGNYGGGGGGGGAGNGDTGGTGGFGGGGGGAGGVGDLLFSANGGNGGFGGGGGAGQSNAGHGGLYGGDAASDSSGGGAGLGGAIFNDGGSVTVRNCTFNTNFVVRGVAGDATAHPGGESGGAIFSLNGTTTVQNATISGNAGDAGGISVRGTTSAAVTLRNTILANDGAPDCSVVGNASVAGSGNLIMSNVSCPGVVTSADPQLGSLQRTVGKTPTMAISGNSPALDTADAGTSLDIDQRGVARPERNGFDIGAYERCPRSGPVLELCQDFGFIPPVDMTTLTTLASPVAGGTVSPPSGEYPVNSVQPLLALSNSGYRFLSWTGNAADPSNLSTYIVIDQPQTVTANFGTCVIGLSGRGVPGNSVAPPRVDLSWSGTTDDRYDLLRSATSGGPYTFVGSSTTTAFSDRTAGLINNTRYYYVLKPIQLQAGGGTHTFCQSNETGVTIPRGR